MMKSLKEISREEIIRYGVGSRGTIPNTLRDELESIENNIQSKMTGRFHLHRDAWDTEDIEIFWEAKKDRRSGKEWSQWRFSNHVTGRSAVVRVDRNISVPTLIADVFQLEPLTSISASFNIDLQDTTVTFHGTYIPLSKGAPVTKFETRFSFRESNDSMEMVTELSFHETNDSMESAPGYAVSGEDLYCVFEERYKKTEPYSPHFCSECSFP